jgi:TM2 domain-containing membrane protein YozV/Tfp pilus assembly protein PilE
MSGLAYCRACGTEVHATAVACPKCGAPQDTGKRYKNKVAAGLLAIFLGGFGAHRFYLGKWWGVFYLLFFWAWIPGLIAFVEGIVILCTDSAKWDEKYNEGRRFGSGSGVGIIIAVVASVFVGIAMIGILAAIAVPAYQDYTTRAKMAEAVSTADKAAAHVRAYILEQRTIPATVQAAGFIAPFPASVRSIDVDEKTATIRVTMAATPVAGKSFRLRPIVQNQSDIRWQCESDDIQPRMLPPRCRQ